MKFEELAAEDQALLNTELDPMLEKEAAEKVAAVNEVYAYGLEQGEAIADEFDKLAAEIAEEEKKEEEEEEEEGEEKKASAEDEAAAELGSFIERGVFDSLTKLGSERHEDPMHYFYPYIEEKVASSAAENAVYDLIEKVAKKDEEPKSRHLRRALLGNPISSAIEAEKGKKLKSFGKAWGHGAKESLKGGAGGALLGTGAGALGAALSRGKMKPSAGAGLGAWLGGVGGSIGGAIKGQHGAKATEIHGEYSKNRKKK